MNTPEHLTALAALPDGTYFDGTYEWVKDETDWMPLLAPSGMSSVPEFARLKRTITRHVALDAPTIPWNETTVEGLASILRSIPADTPEEERQNEWSMWMAQRMFTLLGVTPKPDPDPEWGEWHNASLVTPVAEVTDQLRSAARDARTRIDVALIRNAFTGNGFPSSHVSLAVKDVQAVLAAADRIGVTDLPTCRTYNERGESQCDAPARFIAWGDLYPKLDKGPKCFEHLPVDFDGVPQSGGNVAVFDLMSLAPIRTAEHVEAAARAYSPSQWEVFDDAVERGGEREFPAEYIVRPSIELVTLILERAGIHIERGA